MDVRRSGSEPWGKGPAEHFTRAIAARRRIGADQLPAGSPALLPLDEAAEAQRAARHARVKETL